ncbi:MAG TPA: protein phosphatase 2C domain-containing protein [Polyangia bacterium]|nr:protein phosphatase 2C domain-containing protein [Polyangia bacterium]
MPATPGVERPPLTACGFSHPGRVRDDNEDAFGSFLEERLFVVADGMGGHNAGQVASLMTVDAIETFFRSYHADPRQSWPHGIDKTLSLGANLLRVGIKVANDQVRSAAAADRARARMGSTVVALAVGDAQLTVAHTGDSRAYRIRDDEVKRLTRDHSVLEEMLAVRPDLKGEEVAAFAHRNVVTKSLGSKEEVEPTLYVNTLQRGDRYLLCSDGLWSVVPDERILAIVAANPDIEAACQLLIDAANDAGGPDNITAVLVRVG